MAQVHVLPGIERRDLPADITAEQVLQAAIDAGITDAIIIGRDRQGQQYIAASIGDIDRTVGRIMSAVAFLTNARLAHEGPIAG